MRTKNRMKPARPLLTVSQVADLHGIPRYPVLRELRAGRLAGIPPIAGGKWMVLADAARAYRFEVRGPGRPRHDDQRKGLTRIQRRADRLAATSPSSAPPASPSPLRPASTRA